MKKLLKKLSIGLLYIILLSHSTLVLAQEHECGTLSNYPNLTPQSATTFDDCPIFVNVFFHIVQDNNGNGGIEPSVLPTRFTELQQIFGSAGINLVFGGYDIIKNSNYMDYDVSVSTTLYNTQRKNDALNIYIVSNLYNGPNTLAGMAEAIPSIALIVDKDFFLESTLPHEIGHCFNLFHTHHGIGESGCVELVNGSNCTICGDFICDTPADPKLMQGQSTSVSATCVYTGTEAQNGSPYAPSVNNIMSYAPKNCRTAFTNQQYARMSSSLKDQGMVLKNIRTIPPYTIEGADFFCTNATYYVSNLLANSTVSWSVSPSTAASLVTSGNNVTVTKIQNNVSITLTANITNTCGSKIITRAVSIGTLPPTNILGFPYNSYNFAQNTLYNFSVNAPVGTIGYQWTLSGGTIQSGQGTNAIIVKTSSTTPNVNKYFDVSVKVQNICGWSSYLWRTGYIKYGISGQQRIAEDENTDISMLENTNENEIYDFIRVYDVLGREYLFVQNANITNLQNLPSGRHYIVLSNKNGINYITHLLRQ